VTRNFVSTTLALSLLAACGGGGDDAGGSTAPLITAGNHLDAVYVGVMGGDRTQDAELVADAGYKIARANANAPGTYACPGGGSLTYSTSGTTQSFGANSCVLMSDITLVSGTWSVANLQTTTSASNVTYLSGGAFNYSNVVLRLAAGWRIGADAAPAGDETFNGNLTVARAPNASGVAVGTWSGSLAVLRNGRTDSYTALNMSTTDFDFDSVSQTSEITSSRYRVSTPRFAAGAIDVDIDYRSPVARISSADDGSYVRMTTTTPPVVGQLRYQVFVSSSAAAPTTDEALANTDARVSAAIGRALQ
jgi:hypothetical protein